MNMKNNIGVISVTYKESIISSDLYTSLLKITDEIPHNFIFYNYCNSFTTKHENGLFQEEYSETNGGLALGYNKGLQFFKKKNVSHILFLNSDCIVDLKILKTYVEKSYLDFDYFYPNLYSKNRRISPFRKISFSFDFVIIGWLMVENNIIQKIKFPKKYWLDGIDYFLSLELSKIKAIGYNLNHNIKHNLSISDEYKNTPDWRILNIYISEKQFISNKLVFSYILLKGVIKSIIYYRFMLSYKLLKLL